MWQPVKNILHREWDPLLLREIPHFLASNEGEYDRYVDLVVGMIADDPDVDGLKVQLHKLEVKISGHALPDVKTASIARKLIALTGNGIPLQDDEKAMT